MAYVIVFIIYSLALRRPLRQTNARDSICGNFLAAAGITPRAWATIADTCERLWVVTLIEFERQFYSSSDGEITIWLRDEKKKKENPWINVIYP